MNEFSKSSQLTIFAGALLLVVMSGCAPRPIGGAPGNPAENAQLSAQMQMLNERLSQFDADNRDLHSQVAQLQHTAQLLEQEKRLLRQQLADASTEMQQVEVARQELDQQLSAMQASSQTGGGATITANSSLRSNLRLIEVPGVEVRLDGDVVRIELPADRLFTPGMTDLQPTGAALIDQVGSAIARHYPRQLVGIEGHTDRMTANRSVITAQQLTATQALAVFHHLTRSGRLPAEQLFTVGMGSNRPRFSNAEAIGRASNRRVDIVIYPETVDGN